MDNVPKLRNSSDIEFQPLSSLVHKENSQVEASDEVSSFPLSEPASVLDEVKHELSSLNGLFKKSLHHNLKIEKQVALTCTVVRPDGDESEKLNMAENSFRKCKRSHDELSICQSHKFFEHNLVSHTQCYAEGTSSVANKLDVSSSKRCKAVDNSVDVDSLFLKSQRSEISKTSETSVNMEDDFLELVDSELPGHHLEEKVKDLACSNLAQKIETHWKSPSASSVAKGFKKHKQPANLEGLVLPPMPKMSLKMPSIKDFVASREKRLYSVQNAVVKSSHIIASIADNLMSSEKSSSAVDVKELVLKAFDIISVLSNASVTLSNL